MVFMPQTVPTGFVTWDPKILFTPVWLEGPEWFVGYSNSRTGKEHRREQMVLVGGQGTDHRPQLCSLVLSDLLQGLKALFSCCSHVSLAVSGFRFLRPEPRWWVPLLNLKARARTLL